MKYINRLLEDKITDLLRTFSCLALTGPRQSGKSTLLINCLKEYKYITLDDPLTREQALADPQFFLDLIGEGVIVDEIQLAPGLLSYVKMRVDKDRDKKGMFVFTGSQQFQMIKELGDSLAGRIALLELLPFSLPEKKRALELSGTLDYFVHACLRGSYPELVLNPSLDASAWYGSYIRTYLERDVRTIYNVGNLRDFQRFLQLLAGRCAQILHMSEYARTLGVSVPTIKHWLSILEACRIIYLLPPYYNNLGKRITKAPKVYFLDTGLVCYLTGLKDRDHLLKGPMAGPLFENFCVQETIKIFFNKGDRLKLYYVRTNNNLEVDLLVEESFNRLLPVEIKLSKTPSLQMGANIMRFKAVFSAFECSGGLVVSLVDYTAPLTKEISAVSLDEYLGIVTGII